MSHIGKYEVSAGIWHLSPDERLAFMTRVRCSSPSDQAMLEDTRADAATTVPYAVPGHLGHLQSAH